MARKKLELIKTSKLNPPNDSEFLWRYFDIHKFLCFLQNRTFRFTRMDQFEDPLEGVPLSALTTYAEKVDQNLVHNLSLSELILDQTLFEQLPPMLKKKLNAIHGIHKSTFVSCWFYEQRESMAMWNLYSNPDGVALKMPFGKLRKRLKPSSDVAVPISAYYAGKIVYQDFKSVFPEGDSSKVPKVALRKDNSFSHEREFRFVIRTSSLVDGLVGIDSEQIALDSLGLKAVCHPRMISWKKANVKRILEQAGLPSAFQVSEIRLRP